MNIKVRVFGAVDCDRCKTLTAQLQFVGIPCEFVDANADETQDLCDEHDVDSLPHVQLLTDEKIAYQAVNTDDSPIDVAHLLSLYLSLQTPSR